MLFINCLTCGQLKGMWLVVAFYCSFLPGELKKGMWLVVAFYCSFLPGELKKSNTYFVGLWPLQAR